MYAIRSYYGGAAEIVLEDVEAPVAAPHQVGAGDMTPDPSRRIEADALLAVAAGREHQILRNDAVLENLLVVVEVIDSYNFV